MEKLGNHWPKEEWSNLFRKGYEAWWTGTVGSIFALESSWSTVMKAWDWFVTVLSECWWIFINKSSKKWVFVVLRLGSCWKHQSQVEIVAPPADVHENLLPVGGIRVHLFTSHSFVRLWWWGPVQIFKEHPRYGLISTDISHLVNKMLPMQQKKPRIWWYMKIYLL